MVRALARHILPDASIAAGGSLDQRAILIAQGQGQPVNLGFRGKGQHIRRAEAQVFADAAVEIGDVFVSNALPSDSIRTE